MLTDRKVGLRSIELMTTLGVLENYVAQLCKPIPINSHEEKVPEICFVNDQNNKDAYNLAKLLEANIGETNDNLLFRNMYYLCIFKVDEDEPDILNAALSEMCLANTTKRFIVDNLNKYPYVLNHDLQKASISSIIDL